MKFKNAKNRDCKAISITDFYGDILQVQLNTNGSPGPQALWFKVNESTVVNVERAKALKLAWAIIDELNPGYDTNI